MCISNRRCGIENGLELKPAYIKELYKLSHHSNDSRHHQDSPSAAAYITGLYGSLYDIEEVESPHVGAD